MLKLWVECQLKTKFGYISRIENKFDGLPAVPNLTRLSRIESIQD